MAFSPDSLTLAASGSQVKMWHIPTLQEVATINSGHPPWSLAFSQDGRALAISYGMQAKYVTVWRAPSLEEIAAMERQK